MENIKKIVKLLEVLRTKSPLVHQITNYVTVNDCANITLAIGASPVMADDINEVKDMVSIASALVLNIGTLNARSVESMIVAGKRANELNIPIILDPVGAGATQYRTQTAMRILQEIKVDVIRGNFSEIKTLYGEKSQTKGVDSAETTESDEAEKFEKKLVAAKLALRFNAIVAITGATDIVTDGRKLYYVENGHCIMSKVTGTGCMCTSLIGSYLGAGNNALLAALAGILSMGIAGEIAAEHMLRNEEGTGSLKVRIIDAISRLYGDVFTERGKVYEEECRL